MNVTNDQIDDLARKFVDLWYIEAKQAHEWLDTFLTEDAYERLCAADPQNEAYIKANIGTAVSRLRRERRERRSSGFRGTEVITLLLKFRFMPTSNTNLIRFMIVTHAALTTALIVLVYKLFRLS